MIQLWRLFESGVYSGDGTQWHNTLHSASFYHVTMKKSHKNAFYWKYYKRKQIYFVGLTLKYACLLLFIKNYRYL